MIPNLGFKEYQLKFYCYNSGFGCSEMFQRVTFINIAILSSHLQQIAIYARQMLTVQIANEW